MDGVLNDRAAEATEPRDHRQDCASCGALGLRTVALICPHQDCGDVILDLDEVAAPEPDLQAESAREHTCLRCGALGKPVELIECVNCPNPLRAKDGVEAQPHNGEIAEQTAGEASVGVRQVEVTIDKEFSTLLPPPSEGELAQLEHNLLTDGCQDPILVWDDGQRRIVLDGHNRLTICQRYELSYAVQTIDLPGRDAARLWILEHQLGRRNLTPEAQAYALGTVYKSRIRQGARSDLTSGHSDQKSTTADQLAAKHHVSEKTIRRYALFAEQLDQLAEMAGPSIKHAILARKVKVSFSDVDRLVKLKASMLDSIIPRILRGEAAARLINDVVRSAGADGQHLQTATAPATEEKSGRCAIQTEEQTGAIVPQTGAGESTPTAAPRAANLAGNDVVGVVEKHTVGTVYWRLYDALRELDRVPSDEIPDDLRISIGEKIVDVQDILQAIEEAADE